MQKILLSLIMSFGLSATAFDEGIGSDRLLNLNKKVSALLQPLQNPQTTAHMTFFEIEYNAKRVLSLVVNGLFDKSGPYNHAKVDLQNLSYQYGDGSAPTLKAKGSVEMDFTRLLGQDQLNAMLAEVEAMLSGYASNYLKKYGEAATVSVKIHRKAKDANGNYVSIAGDVSVKIDFSKLPESIKAEDVFWTEATINISAHATKGFTFEGRGIGHPGFKDNSGQELKLRNGLAQLVSLDADALEELVSFFFGINTAADQIVNHKPRVR